MCKQEHRLADCPAFKNLLLEGRRSFVYEHHLCVCCFSTRHRSEECRWPKGCAVAGCESAHHTLLHEYSTENSSYSSATYTLDSSVATKTVQEYKITTSQDSSCVVLGVIPAVVVTADGTSTSINVVFDEGADSTLIRLGLADSLCLVGTPQKLNIDGAAGVTTKSIPSQIVELQIKTETGDFILKGSTLPIITRPSPVVDWSQRRLDWEHLADLPLKKSGGVVDLLIGLDYAHLLVPLESRVAVPDAPIASRSALGWMVRGVLAKDVKSNSVQMLKLCASASAVVKDSPMSTFKEEDQLRAGDNVLNARLLCNSLLRVLSSPRCIPETFYKVHHRRPPYTWTDLYHQQHNLPVHLKWGLD